MPILYNASPNYIQPVPNEPAVAPGDGYEFTDEQIAAGLDGAWVEENPRAGIAEETAWKAERDVKSRRRPHESAASGDATPAPETSPAETGDHEEAQPE